MNNEITKMHFEIKRMHHLLDTMRTHLKSTVETVADLKAQVLSLRNQMQPSVPEAVPGGVSGPVPEPRP